MHAPGGGLGNTEPLPERDAAWDRRADRPDARDDLALDDPRGLLVARDAAQVVKIIHVASLAALAV